MLPRALHERGRPRDAQALERGEDALEHRGIIIRGRGAGRGGVVCSSDEEAREVVAVFEGLVRALAEVLYVARFKERCVLASS